MATRAFYTTVSLDKDRDNTDQSQVCRQIEKQHFQRIRMRNHPRINQASLDWFAAALPISSIEQEIDRNDFEAQLAAEDFFAVVLPTLTPREERVMRMRYGIGGVGSHTLDEIAEAFNVTGQRIRQIELRAMRKLRYSARQAFPGRAFAPDILASGSTKAEASQTAKRAERARQKSAIEATERRRRYHEEYQAARERREAEEREARADARRTALYAEWLRDRDAARLREAAQTPKATQTPVQLQRETRAWTRFLHVIASVLIVPMSVYAVTLTQGHPGYLTFKAAFGPELEPSVRLLTCLLGMAYPIFLIASFLAMPDSSDDIRKPLR